MLQQIYIIFKSPQKIIQWASLGPQGGAGLENRSYDVLGETAV